MAIKINLVDLMWEKRIKSVSELSRKSRVSRPTIMNWMNGNVGRVELEVLDKLCDALECKPEDVIKIVDPKIEMKLKEGSG